MKFFSLSFIVLLIATSANAQSRYEYTRPASTGTYSMEQKDSFKPKKPILGPLFSIGATSAIVLSGFYCFENINFVLGMSLMGAGLVLGPSAGNIYARNFTAVRKGLKYRLGGTAVLAGVTTLAVVGALGGNPLPIIAAIGLVGEGLFLYGVIYDFVTPYKNVKKYNEARHKKLSLSPIYDPVSNSIGLSIKINF